MMKKLILTNLKIHSKDELPSFKGKSGVYLLLKDDKIFYIGMTKDASKRIKQHNASLFYFIDEDEEHLRRLETYLIYKFKPELNIRETMSERLKSEREAERARIEYEKETYEKVRAIFLRFEDWINKGNKDIYNFIYWSNHDIRSLLLISDNEKRIRLEFPREYKLFLEAEELQNGRTRELLERADKKD
jgi:predicted GIY-YIG superfamily endonuclease